MGNCLKRIESEDVVWAGEDWASLRCGKKNQTHRCGSGNNNTATERLRLLSDHHHQMIIRSSSDQDHDHHGGGREVKIRISKKELEQLVGVQGLSTEQLMAHLIINGHDLIRSDHEGPPLENQRSWRPVLQSIPEVN